jgi:hypothetical protein
MYAVVRQRRSVKPVNYTERSKEGRLTMKEEKEMGERMYEVRMQEGMGKGLVAIRDVDVGELVSEYKGRRVTDIKNSTSDRIVQYRGGIRKSSEPLWIIGTPTCPAAMVNFACGLTRSCPANTELILDDRVVNNKKKLLLVTNKFIKEGDFFLLDYGYRYQNGRPSWMKKWYCRVCTEVIVLT